MKKIITIAAFAVIFASGLVATQAHAKVFDLTGWAWSSNVGWFSFSSKNPGAALPAPVGAYNFNADSAVDTSGNAFNGTLQNGATFGTGYVGTRGLQLDGVDDYVGLPASEAYNSATSTTLAAWIKLDVAGRQNRVIAYQSKYRIEVASNNKLYCAFRTLTQSWRFCSGYSNTALLPNVWYHIGVTYDGVSTYTYYLNGQPDGSDSGQLVGNLTRGDYFPCIGYGCDSSANYSGGVFTGNLINSFKGAIDDVRIFNRALTATEMQQVYAGTPSPSVTYSVTVSTTTGSTVGAFGGYAWSPNVGWLSFNSSDVTGCPASESAFDTPGANAGADLPSGVSNICAPRVDLATGKVSGWGRILSMATEDNTTGWMHLSGTNHQTRSGGVTYNTATAAFTGYAWEPSALGWIDFKAQGPGADGVTICKTGIDPNCPIVVTGGVTGTCNLSSTNVPAGTIVQLSLSGVSGGTGPYTYDWAPTTVGNGHAVAPSPYNYTYGVPGTYTPSVVISDTAGHSSNITCSSITVTGTSGPSTGLKLMIASPTTSLQADDYNDAASTFKTLKVVKGNQFKLQWNIDPTVGYDTCDYFPPAGFTLSGGTNSSSGILPTAGVNTGMYTFSLMCSVAGKNAKSSSAQLNVVSSSVEEI